MPTITIQKIKKAIKGKHLLEAEREVSKTEKSLSRAERKVQEAAQKAHEKSIASGAAREVAKGSPKSAKAANKIYREAIESQMGKRKAYVNASKAERRHSKAKSKKTVAATVRYGGLGAGALASGLAARKAGKKAIRFIHKKQRGPIISVKRLKWLAKKHRNKITGAEVGLGLSGAYIAGRKSQQKTASVLTNFVAKRMLKSKLNTVKSIVKRNKNKVIVGAAAVGGTTGMISGALGGSET